MSPVSAVTEKGRVRITVSAIAGTLFTVTRTHPSGRILPVRGMTLSALSGGVAVGWDYEAPIGLPVDYTAYAYDANDPNTPIEVSTPITVTWPFTTEWLKDPLEPVRNMPITIREMNKYTFQSRTASHRVLSRPASVTVSEVRSGAVSTFSIFTYTKEERDRLHYLTSSGHALLLQGTQESEIGNMYISIIGDIEEERVVQNRDFPVRVWTLPYEEVDSPIGDPSPFVTYADLVAPFVDYASMAAPYTSYLEMVESVDRATPLPTITWRGA